MILLMYLNGDYSPGYGTATVDELIRRAADSGYAALDLTDIDNLYGQVRFHHEARLRRLKAVTGVELRAESGPGTPGRKQCGGVRREVSLDTQKKMARHFRFSVSLAEPLAV